MVIVLWCGSWFDNYSAEEEEEEEGRRRVKAVGCFSAMPWVGLWSLFVSFVGHSSPGPNTTMPPKVFININSWIWILNNVHI